MLLLANSYWANGAKKEAVAVQRELHKRYLRPQGLFVQPVECNKEVFSQLPKTVKARELRLRSVQLGLAKAGLPLIQVIDQLTKTPDTLDLQTVVNQLLDGLKMMACTNGLLNQTRRDLMRTQFTGRTATVFTTCPPVESSLLLGDDLPDQVKAVNQTAGLKLVKRQFQNTARGHQGRGRYRGWHPYYSGYGRGRGRPYGGWGHQDHGEFHVSRGITPGLRATDHDQQTTQDDLISLSRSPRQEAQETGPQEGRLGCTAKRLNLDPQVCSLPCKWREFQAGRISQRIQKWRDITSDRMLLRQIQACTIEFVESPYQRFPEQPLRFSCEERKFAREEIENLKNKGVICEVEHVAGEFISNIFLRPKKEKGKYRMILNLKKLNEFVEYHHFKMDTLETVLTLIRPGMFMASIDFTDAYYSLAIAEHHRKYLRFEFDDVLYEFTCLPNGLSSGPRVFTKILKVPLAWLRQSFGVTISGYIDDTILCAETASQLCSDLAIAAELFQDLGFMISWKKSVLEPTQELEFLGFLINSVTGRVSLPVAKADNIVQMVRKALGQVRFTIREVAQLLGVLVATSPGNRWAQLYTRALDIEKTEALRANYGNYEAYMSVSPMVYEDLEWWKTNVHLVFSEIWGGSRT
jgi:hypothetical protein